MPWQRDAVDVALELDPATGHYHYSIVVMTVPRQAGKSALVGHVADHRCLTRPDARVWITQQTGDAASQWMRDEQFPSLERTPAFTDPTGATRYKLSRRAGSVGVSWPALGSTFRSFPPMRDALHGKQSDLAAVDEAWALSRDQGAAVRQAIRPTMATRRGAQLWVVSTMGDDLSEYLDGYVEMARGALADPSARVALVDYGIGDDVDPTDLDAVAAAHPAVGHTIDVRALEDALTDFLADPERTGGVAGFARAYGNRPTRSRITAFPAGAWTACTRPDLPIPDRAGIAVDATPSGGRVAVAAAWRDADDGPCLEILYSGPPSRDTGGHVAALCRKYGSELSYDPVSVGALDVVEAAIRADRRVKAAPVNTREYGSACAVITRAVGSLTLAHRGIPSLNDAVDVATKRPLGDGGFGWGRKQSNGSIAELVAATLALRQYDTAPTKRKPTAVAARR
jgi:hypothetical protein